MNKTSKAFLRIFIAFIFTILILCGIRTNNAYAGNTPTWHAGSRAENCHDYFEEDGIWYKIAKKPENGKNGQVYAGGCRDYVEKLVIPGIVEHSRKKYEVIGIDDYAFSGSKQIKSLKIGEGVEYIGERAFALCTGLEQITFPDSINEVGIHAFRECNSLKSVTTPKNLKELPGGMFSSCEALESVTIGKNTVSIGEGTFYFCRALKKVKFNKALKSIGNAAFQSCTSLPSVKFTSKISSIGEYAFSHCSALKKLTLPKKLKEIQENCFENCDELKTVKLPAELVIIGYGAFSNCKNLTTVSGKNTKLETIDESAFYRCENLISFKGNNVKLKKIGDHAFSQCKSLKEFTFGSRIAEIGQSAFYHSLISEVNFTDSLTSMGQGAFAYCQGITEITIPGTLKNIPDEAFSECFNLSEVTIEKNVESIGSKAFWYCDSLVKLSYPDTIHRVGYNAFEYSRWFEFAQGKQIYSLKENGQAHYSYRKQGDTDDDYSRFQEFICINDVCIWASEYRKETTPQGHEHLTRKTELEFPSNVKVISCLIRGGSKNFEKIKIHEGVTRIDGEIYLESTYNPSEIVLPSTLTELEGRITGDGFRKITLPENLEVLGKDIFTDSKNLESVVFKGNKLKVLTAAFRRTGSLKKIVIPEGVEEIEEWAFDESGLEEVTLPSTLKKIGDYAFFKCSLKEVNLNKGLAEIGREAFYQNQLSSVKLPDSIRKIGIYAFEGTGIEKITLPNKFLIEEDIVNKKEFTVYVKKNSSAHKALEELIKKKYLSGWKVKFK
ncbi:MAG: leucine-rich repeat domain-containing protein [Lachnospiraceae bacterium]|nr:leucine-rich repeat domain-containing protein [Lachnospiraceae bacterium]